MIHSRKNATIPSLYTRVGEMIGSFHWTVSAFYFMLDPARASFFDYDLIEFATYVSFVSWARPLDENNIKDNIEM